MLRREEKKRSEVERDCYKERSDEKPGKKKTNDKKREMDRAVAERERNALGEEEEDELADCEALKGCEAKRKEKQTWLDCIETLRRKRGRRRRKSEKQNDKGKR